MILPLLKAAFILLIFETAVLIIDFAAYFLYNYRKELYN